MRTAAPIPSAEAQGDANDGELSPVSVPGIVNVYLLILLVIISIRGTIVTNFMPVDNK